MGSFTLRRQIDAPPDVVFDAMSDFKHAADRVSAIERIEILSDGPIGAGTRFRETRRMFGKEATEEMSITAFDRVARHYAIECHSCGSQFRTDVRCDPDNGGTRVTMETSYQPITVVAKMMVPVGWLMAGTMRKCIEKDLDDIEAHVNAQGATSTQPVA